ncbi:hypothetical protein O181_004232 [Austropuccinia psidii MF-1]|uniref:Uncharacterized protein n=1 Tax=Austropuccinia psidii MF-1 TaxID=1389203 RepID=A0A9Q3GFK9_9BASI|nr:hypothetical protein [Austropuccinia psidii MF-1]
MPLQKSTPARNTRSQVRAQAVLTPIPRGPIDGTPAVPQLRAHFDICPLMEGEAPSRKEGRGPRRFSSLSGVAGTFPGISRTTLKVHGTGGPTLSKSNNPVSHHYEPSLFTIIQQMSHIMGNIQPSSSSEASRPPAFNSPSMKEPDFFDGTQPFRVRSFIQSFQPMFHNDK